MAYIINTNELPDTQYTPIKAGDTHALFGVLPGGVVILYPAVSEAVIVPWSEIVEYAAGAEKKQLPKPVEPEPVKKKVRDATTKPQ